LAKRKPTQYAWQDLEYTPYYLNKHTEAELRKEYSKLRSIVRKRQERLEKSEFAELSEVKHYGKLPPVAQIKNKQQLVYALAEAKRFLNQDISITRFKRERKDMVTKLNANGYDFITQQNFTSFVEFMEDMRTIAQNTIVDSEIIAMLYNSVSKGKISASKLQKWFTDFIKKQEQSARDYPAKYSRIKGGKVKIESKDLEEWASRLFGG
jgi:hypothetical protein